MHMSMGTHFCYIALCAKPYFCSRQKKKKAGQKHYKKRIPAFYIAHYLKRKKKRKTLHFFFFLAKVCETNFFFWPYLRKHLYSVFYYIKLVSMWLKGNIVCSGTHLVMFTVFVTFPSSSFLHCDPIKVSNVVNVIKISVEKRYRASMSYP